MHDYVGYLERRLAEASGQKKTVRTEMQLELATARLLGDKAFHAISVDMIAESAGLAHGTFYRYFAGKREVVAKTLADYLDFIPTVRPAVPRDASAFDAIYTANLNYIHCFRQNVGLMKCLFHVKDEDPLIAAVSRRADEKLFNRVIRSYRSRTGDEDVDLVWLRLTTYCLIGMVDELLLKIYGQTNPPLAEFADDAETVARILTDLWVKALYEDASQMREPARAVA